MKIEIKSRRDASILFSIETDSWRLALEAAVKSGADLRGADLHGAKGLDKFPIQIAGHRHFIQTTGDGQLQIGCEVHSFEAWKQIPLAEELGAQNEYSALDVKIYELHIEHTERISKLLWNSEVKG